MNGCHEFSNWTLFDAMFCSRLALRRWSWRHNILWRTKNHWWTMALETKNIFLPLKCEYLANPSGVPLQALQIYHLKGRRACKVIESLCHFAKIFQLICCSQMQFIVVWTMSLNFFPWSNPYTLIAKQVFKWSHYLLHHIYNQFFCQIASTMHNSQYQIIS